MIFSELCLCILPYIFCSHPYLCSLPYGPSSIATPFFVALSALSWSINDVLNNGTSIVVTISCLKMLNIVFKAGCQSLDSKTNSVTPKPRKIKQLWNILNSTWKKQDFSSIQWSFSCFHVIIFPLDYNPTIPPHSTYIIVNGWECWTISLNGVVRVLTCHWH